MWCILVIYLIVFDSCECLHNKHGTKSITSTTKNIIIEMPKLKQTQDLTFQVPEDGWVSMALKDIAYYLRNHKFNEWDHRLSQNKPNEDSIGFYKQFPEPPLKFFHWNVEQNCHQNFYKCIIYLQSVVETAPMTRKDDVLTLVNANLVPMNIALSKLENECKNAVSNADKTGVPFDGPKERFVWRVSASYFMCWYTLLETPALSMLGETCDNFANCLDPIHGSRNHDYRANDTQSFACAMYSFCPDPCCPLKHVKSAQQDYRCKENPCLLHNHNAWSKRDCKFDRKSNQNLNSIVANKWNISCNCEEHGFIWNFQFGMCVDKNECVTNENDCNNITDDCLNIPGSYQCICKWGFAFDNITKKCIRKQ